jgi:diguanylate cyclase (GGDEF)-like protein
MDQQTAFAPDKPVMLWPAAHPDIPEVAVQLGHYGYRAEPYEDLTALLHAADTGQPSSILIGSASFKDLGESDRSRIRALAQRLPLTCLSDKHDIEARLEAVRMGCQAYFTRPLDMTSLLETLDRQSQPNHADAGKVLIVDDSPSLAAFYAANLKHAGFTTEVVTNPLKALDAIADSTPELILLDMHMPGATGEELAKVIRQQEAYLSIPIVFLSAENDISRQREAMTHGGDEFLQKPIDPNHLISAVRARLVRYRALRALMVRDSLTGLLNHTSFKERLRAEVARGRRLHQPLSVALLDIDHFKRVNDTYGHPAGDRVIKSLARLLKQRLRGADVIGRYGGEEFAVALPETPLSGAIQALDNLRMSFANIVQISGENTFQVTLSCGVTEVGEAMDGDSSIQAADEALYAAKHGGRNQVCAASPETLQAMAA